jgi:glycosyltransferase involved in cell wall biosynthesis
MKNILNILINFSTLKKGGGQNVAMNFLIEIDKINTSNYNFFYFVAKNSTPHTFFLESGYKNFYVVSDNPYKRIFFEITQSKFLLKNLNIDIIYSYFGAGLFNKKIPQVSGNACSNLYFPEIDFWSNYKGLPRLKKKIIDSYRIYCLKRVSGVIFENPIMEERSKKLFDLKKTIFIKPSISIINSSEINQKNKSQNRKIKKGLFLCGWQLNKKVMKIPELAFYCGKLNYDLNFILTAPKDNSNEHKNFNKLVEYYNVADRINHIGAVKKESLRSLYDSVDFVFLLSKLESFSNNIIESWYYKKILIISDELWSKSICKKSAYYVNRESSEEIIKSLIYLDKNLYIKKKIINSGTQMLKKYPSTKEKIFQELNFIDDVYKNF